MNSQVKASDAAGGSWGESNEGNPFGSCSSIAFGNQTISRSKYLLETHGFASSLHSEFAFIACNRFK